MPSAERVKALIEWVEDELALQRWRGDRVAEERFYYDPTQLSP